MPDQHIQAACNECCSGMTLSCGEAHALSLQIALRLWQLDFLAVQAIQSS
jgi:hypothetical protein